MAAARRPNLLRRGALGVELLVAVATAVVLQHLALGFKSPFSTGFAQLSRKGGGAAGVAGASRALEVQTPSTGGPADEAGRPSPERSSGAVAGEWSWRGEGAQQGEGDGGAPGNDDELLGTEDLQVAAERAYAAWAAEFDIIAASAKPSYMGLPCDSTTIAGRFVCLAGLVGAEEAALLVEKDPIVLMVGGGQLRRSWKALVQVAEGNESAALSVLQKNPGLLTAPSFELKGKSLSSLDAVASAVDMIRPASRLAQDSFQAVYRRIPKQDLGFPREWLWVAILFAGAVRVGLQQM